MAMILDHMIRPGHKCRNPIPHTHASYIKAGEIIAVGGWQLFYSEGQRAYIVSREDLTGDYYQYGNFNCATTKLKELGWPA